MSTTQAIEAPQVEVFVSSYQVKCFCEGQGLQAIELLGMDKFKQYAVHQMTATLGISFYLIPEADKTITINAIRESVQQWFFNKNNQPEFYRPPSAKKS